MPEWLLARKGLPAALVWRLCDFLEANGLLKGRDKPRHAEGALVLQAGLTDAIEQRIPVAIPLTDRGWQSLLPDSASPPKGAIEVIGSQSATMDFASLMSVGATVADIGLTVTSAAYEKAVDLYASQESSERST